MYLIYCLGLNAAYFGNMQISYKLQEVVNFGTFMLFMTLFCHPQENLSCWAEYWQVFTRHSCCRQALLRRVLAMGILSVCLSVRHDPVRIQFQVRETPGLHHMIA